MPERMREIISAEQVSSRIAELGEQINADYQDKSLLIVAVLRGGVYFAVDLSRCINRPLALDFIEISTYGETSDLHGVVRITKDTEEPITGQHVLLVEDIVDTGLSLSYLLRALMARQPADIAVCTLIDSPVRRLVSVPVKYVGFTVDEENLVGCGLDYQQQWRNLPYIASLHSERQA